VFDLTLPVLRRLADGADCSIRKLTGELTDELGLAEDTLIRTRADGRNLFQNRIEWARTWLKKAGLIEYPRPSWSRITRDGLQLLASQPQRLDDRFFKLGHVSSSHRLAEQESDSRHSETLEDELRRLLGPAVGADGDWKAVRLINGWGPEPPLPYHRVAERLGLERHSLLDLGRSCRTHRPDEAPLLDAALTIALAHPDQDPDQLSLELALSGITRDAFSLQGLCEAARRFGRAAEWQRLVCFMSRNRGPNRRPRPFESWFELDVFLHLADLGYVVTPQKSIGRYRVDLFLPELVPQVVVECDGDLYHGGERTERDEAREQWLLARGYNVVRFRWSDFHYKPESMKQGLADVLESIGGGRQLRLA
jgi:very-short-patch-repair endonuclease